MPIENLEIGETVVFKRQHLDPESLALILDALELGQLGSGKYMIREKHPSLCSQDEFILILEDTVSHKLVFNGGGRSSFYFTKQKSTYGKTEGRAE